jgi:pimeloyl-ACP methyl ester carboxylesterase
VDPFRTEHVLPAPGWPPGATSAVADLDGPVRWLDLGGPAGGPVALCVHGLGGSALNWGLLGPLLAASHRVLAVDLFGHGRSGLPRTGGGLAADRALVRRFVAEVVGEPVLLVGHSMGGVLAALHAADVPRSLRGLVLLAPPVPGSSGRVDAALAAKRLLLRTPGVAALVRRTLAGLNAEQVVERQLRDATPHRDRVPAEAVAASVAETRERQARPDATAAHAEQWAGIVDTMALLARPRAWRRVLASVDVPTLWLQGADDPLADASAARATAASRPDWPFEVRDGVGHLLALEDPAWVEDRIRAWLPQGGPVPGGAAGVAGPRRAGRA